MIIGLLLQSNTVIGDVANTVSTVANGVQNAENIRNLNIVTNIQYLLIVLFATIIVYFHRGNLKLSEKIESKGNEYSDLIIAKGKEYGNIIDQIRVKHAEQIALITDKYNNKIEEIRVETMRRDDERNTQWITSEKGTLQVLNGVSKIIEVGEKTGRFDYEKLSEQIASLEIRIMDSLTNIHNKS